MLRPLRACERATQVQVLGKAWTACRRRGIFSFQGSPALAPVAGSYWPSVAVLRRQEEPYSLGGLVTLQVCVTSVIDIRHTGISILVPQHRPPYRESFSVETIYI